MEIIEDIQITKDRKECLVTWWTAHKPVPDCYGFNINTLEGLQPILDRLSGLFGIEVVVKYKKP